MKIAAVALLWLFITFVFAAGFYLSSIGSAITLSWQVAANIAIRNWFPWILLSPVAMMLAGRFGFSDEHWRRNVLLHVAACLVFTVAYQVISFAFPPLPPPGTPGQLAGNGGPMPPPGFRDSAQKPPAAFQGGPPPMEFGGPGGFPQESELRHFLRQSLMKTQFVVPIYWCIVCVCWGIKHVREAGEGERRNLELQSRLTQANLQALKMQLQPHFLFNALNAISSLIHDDPKRADDMVASLSQFLRITLDMSSKNEIPLGEELEFVNCYLEIQRVRFGNRLRIVRDIDPAAAGAMVPPLLFQPLVENAIRYGIETRESGGCVTIRALRAGDRLVLEVCDDGAGFKPEALSDVKRGVGLSNTQSRLRELYGDAHHFTLAANQPAGACVKIEIPWKAGNGERA